MLRTRQGIRPDRFARLVCRYHDGFTLIELMTAIVIVAILLAVGTPSFTTFIQNMQIRSVAESLQSGLNLARDEAVKRNARVSLWLVDGLASGCALSASGNAWVVSLDDPSGSCNAAPSVSLAPRLLQSRSLGEGSSNVAVTGAGGSCVTFNGFGRLEDECNKLAPLTRVDFKSRVAPAATRALAVTLLAGGAVKLCNPAVSDAADSNFCQTTAP